MGGPKEYLASEEAVGLIRIDATDAAGLKFTPMVFINGKPIDMGYAK